MNGSGNCTTSPAANSTAAMDVRRLPRIKESDLKRLNKYLRAYRRFNAIGRAPEKP